MLAQLAGGVEPLGLRLESAAGTSCSAVFRSVRPNCSSLISRSSVALVIAHSLVQSLSECHAVAVQDSVSLTSSSLHRSTLDEPHAHRHLVRQPRESRSAPPLRSRREISYNIVARLHHRGPILRLTFALAHAGFERDRRDRLVREDADVQPAFGAQVLLRGDAAGFDRLRAGIQPPCVACKPKSPKTTRLPRVALPFIRPLWLFRCLTLLGISAIGLVLVIHALVDPHLDTDVSLRRSWLR